MDYDMAWDLGQGDFGRKLRKLRKFLRAIL
jgi:hypothetical protein